MVKKLIEIGAALAVFGVGSSVMNLMDMNFTILMWIDNWGDGVGWAIRAGMTVLGAGLIILGAMRVRGTG